MQRHIRFDWAIKKLLRSKANFGILEGFLSELLDDDITIIQILESESNLDDPTDKLTRVDVLVEDANHRLIIIEIQNTTELDYLQRILYYSSRAITDHIQRGDAYEKVKKIITVSIVYFDLGQGDDYIYKGNTTFYGRHKNDVLQLSKQQKELLKRDCS